MRFWTRFSTFIGLRLCVLAVGATLIVLLVVALGEGPGPVYSATSGAGSDFTLALSWSEDMDLDLHVTGLSRDEERFHVCHSNPVENGVFHAGDEDLGGRAEIVRISDGSFGPFQVYVYDYTHRKDTVSNDLADAGARLAVFENGEPVGVYGVAGRPYGNLWSVIAVQRDSIIPVGTVTYERREELIGRNPRSTLIPGDILLGTQPDNNIPTRWSHVGIYVGHGLVAEAVGTEYPVRFYPLSDWEYPVMTFVSYYRVVSADEEIRSGAVDFITKQVSEDRPYDIGFHSKQADGGSWYCSELVWAAYIHASGGEIDIENTPDFLGVYPWEIEHSGEVALVGGHYEELPDRNLLRMACTGIVRLCEYALVPAGESAFLFLADSPGHPNLAAALFMCFTAAIMVFEARRSLFDDFRA